jgi:AcrR family transcriptional regulator
MSANAPLDGGPGSLGVREAQKARTRAALLEAGRAAFAGLGYEQTRIADIASRAGVASGTVYLHFPEGKEALVDALLAEFNEGMARALAPVLAGASEAPLERLVRDAAEAFFTHWDRHRDFVRTYAERSTAGVTIESLRDGVNPPVADLLRRALTEAMGPTATCSEDADLLAHAVLAMWLRLGLQYLYNPHVTRDAALAILVRATVGAVGAVLLEEVDHA